MVAASCAAVAPIELERLRSQIGETGKLIDGVRDVHQLRPRRGGLDVDLQYPRVRRHHDLTHTRILGGPIALQHHRHAHRVGRVLNYLKQFHHGFELHQRW